jgi:hypothetical protein
MKPLITLIVFFTMFSCANETIEVMSKDGHTYRIKSFGNYTFISHSKQCDHPIHSFNVK